MWLSLNNGKVYQDNVPYEGYSWDLLGLYCTDSYNLFTHVIVTLDDLNIPKKIKKFLYKFIDHKEKSNLDPSLNDYWIDVNTLNVIHYDQVLTYSNIHICEKYKIFSDNNDDIIQFEKAINDLKNAIWKNVKFS